MQFMPALATWIIDNCKWVACEHKREHWTSNANDNRICDLIVLRPVHSNAPPYSYIHFIFNHIDNGGHLTLDTTYYYFTNKIHCVNLSIYDPSILDNLKIELRKHFDAYPHNLQLD